MKNLFNDWKTKVFNIAELLLILLSGYLLKLTIIEIIVVVVSFCGVRVTTKSAMHYKSWKRCLFWSLFLMTSLLLLVKVDIVLAVCMSALAGFIVSGKGDINDCFMYNNSNIKNTKKYRELKRYVDNNKETNELEKFEIRLKNFNNKYRDRFKLNLYELYKLIFYEDKTYKEVIETMKLRDDNHIIINGLDMVFICFNTYIEMENELNNKKIEELA